ncbi:hypothetical protein H0H81_000125 [Sphagnurus paluster]|uniref:F-box domain-containing protein n=1 Tax=Sphagnurus paluster TaxID=117069 RepID=A0A9P7KKB5_9AGAR|nr:hypothetical protein H0H81_000125 [Sphagnurus paluster]
MLQFFDIVEELTATFSQLNLNERSFQDIDPRHALAFTSSLFHEGMPSLSSGIRASHPFNVLPRILEQSHHDKDTSNNHFTSTFLHAPPPFTNNPSPLPDDIIYHLLQFVQTPDPLESLHSVVIFSHVCAQWRAVAVHAPLLWTYVQLAWSPKQINHSAVVGSFLERSRDLPLSIHLIIDLMVEPYIQQWSLTLLPHAHRFRELVMGDNSGVLEHAAMRLISPLEMTHLSHFHFSIFEEGVCTFMMHPQPRKALPQLESNITIPNLPFSCLDWTVCNFHVTSLSLKYLEVTPSELLPILVLAQTTLTHLEYYAVAQDEDISFPPITLSQLTSLHIGYTLAQSAYALVDRLVAPNLSSVLVHDFGRCPETKTPTALRDDARETRPDWLQSKDACDLLMALCSFTQITNLTMRGVTCFLSVFEDVMLPLQYLFQGLKSLVLVHCDSLLMHALFDFTLDAALEDLEGLSELVITSDDDALVLNFLRLRAARGLPKLKLFSVNPRIAILRHFYRGFSADLHVNGQICHQPRKYTLGYPNPREAYPRR